MLEPERLENTIDPAESKRRARLLVGGAGRCWLAIVSLAADASALLTGAAARAFGLC